MNINGIDWAKRFKLNSLLIQKKPDIVAISETHLKGEEVLNYFGYTWEGENHRNARKADRGVGFLIRKEI